jgi:hypothetical protein
MSSPAPPAIMEEEGCNGSGSGDNGISIVVDQGEAEARINLALLEPQKWGWTAAGGIADLLPPHEVSLCARYAVLCFLFWCAGSTLFYPFLAKHIAYFLHS